MLNNQLIKLLMIPDDDTYKEVPMFLDYIYKKQDFFQYKHLTIKGENDLFFNKIFTFQMQNYQL